VYAQRECSPLLSHIFLFNIGARGTGKSTLLRELIPAEKDLWIDLLKPQEDAILAESPEVLIPRLDALQNTPDWVVIAEVQNVPKLLDPADYKSESRKIKCALAG
jgi:hypothetical protein